MATDLTAELSENAHLRPKPILPLDSGFAIAGNVGVDRHQDRRSSDTGPPSSATLSAAKEGMDSQRAAVGRIPEYHASVFDIFKKIRRAERFGIPVRLSEAEKRYSRAESYSGTKDFVFSFLRSEMQKVRNWLSMWIR
ncbi:uncharacterized protein LOC111015100 isoform X2 [Momordica charantia]|uniref:Uncharacterized protein LOC111015100 isoform X2 n=1 Tax=Momordica charantia TaxID=3673 RepID=A0A6J1CW18_MOMCH|nr:uncharacterized protein LOC111015100 isoform X2 [Momordica charantia]